MLNRRTAIATSLASAAATVLPDQLVGAASEINRDIITVDSPGPRDLPPFPTPDLPLDEILRRTIAWAGGPANAILALLVAHSRAISPTAPTTSPTPRFTISRRWPWTSIMLSWPGPTTPPTSITTPRSAAPASATATTTDGRAGRGVRARGGGTRRRQAGRRDGLSDPPRLLPGLHPAAASCSRDRGRSARHGWARRRRAGDPHHLAQG